MHLLVWMTLLVSVVPSSAIYTPFKFWCGKRYNASSSSYDGYNIGWGDYQFDMPHGSQYHKVKLIQNELPYLSGDDGKQAKLAVFIPEIVFNGNHNSNITVSVPDLNAKSTVSRDEAGKAHTFECDISAVSEGKSTLSADLSYATYYNGTTVESKFDTVVFDIYKLPKPAKGNTVKLHADTSALSVDDNSPFVPVGYYVSNNDVVGSTEEHAESRIKEYAQEGYNMFMYTGIVDNSTQMEWTLKYAEKYGLYFQADVVELCNNITALQEYIDKYSTHPAFLSYYIGNEPDGDQGIGSFEPVQSMRAHQFIKMQDPYHPVTLVTNCAHTAGVYSQNVDWMMTDIYSVGITNSRNGMTCTELEGDCGCDMCDFDNPIKSIADRFESVWQDTGIYTGCSFVEQTFHDANSYWSRSPSYDEELAMAWISVVAGSNGVLGYTWPVSGFDEHSHPTLDLAISDVAKDLTGKLGKDTILSGPRIHYGSQGGVYYASWSSGTIIAVNTNTDKQPVALSVGDLLVGNVKKTVKARQLGRSGSNTTSDIGLDGGLLVDKLPSLGVKVYS